MKYFASMNDGLNINIIREIDENEYQAANNILRSMERLVLIYSSKFPLYENYKEIIELIDNYLSGKIYPMVVKYLIVVRIQNFLSSVRGYFDTFTHTLSREYGKESDILLEFEKQKSKAYDGNFSYRFIDTLRNFVQHRALPLSELKLSSENGRKTLKLIIKKCDLMDDKKIPLKKKNDIDANCSDEIELTPHLTTMFGCLMIIHDQMLRMAIDSKQIEDFFMYEKQFSDIKGSLILLDRNYKENDDIELCPRPFNFVTIRAILEVVDEVFEKFYNKT